MVPAIKYRDDAPNILLMWILSIILIIIVIIIVSLSLYICRSKRKFIPGTPQNKNHKLLLHQEFPHEKITRYSSTMRRIKEDNPLLQKLKDTEQDNKETLSRSSSRGDLGNQVTTSHSIISVQPCPTGNVVFNPLHPKSGSKRYQHKNSKETLSKKFSITSDINECGLPIPPPPPIPPEQNFLRSFSVGQLKKTRVQFPRSSIRRSIKKYHWKDVNNNDDTESYLDSKHSLTPYNEETMKSSGESVYF